MQKTFKAEGLVLQTRSLGESDKLITLLTREEGKFTAVARGARKMKSRLAGGVDLFTRGQYSFHRGRTWPIITGQEVCEHFSRFREDPDLYPYGLYLSELTDTLIAGEEYCPEIYFLLLEGWRLLSQCRERLLLCRAFELKLAHLTGYSPSLQRCAVCGSEKFGETKTFIFSPREGGLLCSNCLGGESIKLDYGTVVLARRLLEAPLEQLNIICPSVLQKKELDKTISSFLAYHLDLNDLKSKRLLKE